MIQLVTINLLLGTSRVKHTKLSFSADLLHGDNYTEVHLRDVSKTGLQIATEN
jgi:hypothetical protein